MSDYTIAVSWSGKDALADSDSAKVISGTDFNTEFTTIRTAVNSKADVIDATQDVTTNDLTVTGDLAVTGTTALTGVPTAPTQSAGNDTTRIATTAFATTADNLKANIASPTFTGTPAAPTAAAATNTTQIATTAMVQAATPFASETVAGMAKIWTSGGDLYIALS